MNDFFIAFYFSRKSAGQIIVFNPPAGSRSGKRSSPPGTPSFAPELIVPDAAHDLSREIRRIHVR
jgi:hypothetical protein